jgi:GTP-binding protein Era
LNKTDLVNKDLIDKAVGFFSDKKYCKKVAEISALKNKGIKELLDEIIEMLPEGEPFYNDDNLSDLPMKFFVSELIREKIFYLYQDEIPYHSTVLVQEFKEKTTLTKITADIILQRETQKGIVLGEGGKMIKQLGTLARKDIEEFIGRKVFLELFVKVRPKWRDNEIHLREYGY